MRVKAVAAMIAAVMLLMTGPSLHADDAPTTSKGVSGKVTGTIPLQGMFDSSDGLQMRAREVTIAPGGRIALHHHDNRPELIYLIEGEVTDHIVSEDRKATGTAGMTMTAPAGVTHWVENSGDVPVRAIVVDIVPVK
ncbi:MAG: cupin domain-containing protein [Rhodospirillales bacterium]|nr:cupin domain-containing protein [Rhodospirillales bacterium]